MATLPLLLGLLVVVNLVLLLWLLLYQRSGPSQAAGIKELVDRSDGLQKTLSEQFSAATADMATRLEQTKGDLRQQVTDRLADGFSGIRAAVENQMKAGRQEQAERLGETRSELAGALAMTTSALKSEFDRLNQQTAESLERIRERVDAKLMAITEQVQSKLDQNIKEGFAQFEKVQQHLRAAEEQLREVGALGHSINDLNNLLKLPHLRGTFGEASLERLLSDFLPANMFEMQCSVNGGGRVDAMINFPERRLPVDAKFPREQVLAFFEESSEAELESARVEFQLLLPAEGSHPSAVCFEMSGRFVESLLRFVQALADGFKLVLEVVERFLCFGQFLSALFETAGNFVPLVDEGNGLQRHQQSIRRNRKHMLLVEPIGKVTVAHRFHI